MRIYFSELECCPYDNLVTRIFEGNWSCGSIMTTSIPSSSHNLRPIWIDKINDAKVQKWRQGSLSCGAKTQENHLDWAVNRCFRDTVPKMLTFLLLFKTYILPIVAYLEMLSFTSCSYWWYAGTTCYPQDSSVFAIV